MTQNDLQLATVGTLASGHPRIDYDAVYPVGHPREGLPIFRMLHNGEIVHGDLTAIITGPGRGRFPAATYPPNPTLPDRSQPFREFTVIFHDEIGAVQAFPIFEDPVFEFTLHGVRDGFAINYGTAAVGAEMFANRLGVGPAYACAECKYEEFFLSSWPNGDPAMVVDVPANATDGLGNLIPGPKATRVLYPDDQSNVYHSYLGDHVKFRNLHAGPKEHHVFHLHAHQWLRTPDSDTSTYLDSQMIGPGASFTYEIAYNGGGNRNKTVGDAIFHCHFYPHFAQGMWALWRVHDVFEAGTPLDATGRPAAGSRALPDGEILAGTPIPAVVPLPTLAMAPLPGATARIQVDPGTGEPTGQAEVIGTGNPGYPFFVPGVAGHRPPHPPLDTVDDGGLPRHVILSATASSVVTRLDFSKALVSATAVQLPEAGTDVEQAAMAFHAQRLHPSMTPEGTAADYVTNGRPAVAGAPYADPCVDDAGKAAGSPRVYKAATIQLDLKFNKAGWHFPQARIQALWGDVAATLAGTRPPEPLFMRANTNDCVTYLHTTLIPNVYEQDDFQVRTPTDIVGQHIHLVKFDVTSSDGSGNGWNYEDGAFAPDEVVERITAINATGGLTPFGGGTPVTLAPAPHPFFGTPGAQTTVQRWFADDVLNNLGQDRTLRTVFTHDHFAPSTHQQTGHYSGLLIEPQGSTWRHPETGELFGTRFDGGPTSWRADIIAGPGGADSYREFTFAFGDFQLAYRPDGTPVNPPARKEVGLPLIVQVAPGCPGGVPRPCPEAVSADDVGTMTVNYRNEPLPLRVRDPRTNTQAAGDAGDLALAFKSTIVRADAAMNTQPGFYPPLTADVHTGDPFTPLLRAYRHDRAQVRVLVGAHEEGHNFSIEGVRWLFEPSDPNSGYRNSQAMGLSEHYEFELPDMHVHGDNQSVDYLYSTGSSTDDRWNGLWGLMRVYNGLKGLRSDLLPLPSNPDGGPKPFRNSRQWFAGCPRSAPDRAFDISVVAAADALPGGTLVYNPRTTMGGPLHDPTALLYVRTADLDPQGRLKPGVPVEPLILRAAAGDCISVTLRNQLPAVLPDLPGFATLPMIVDDFNTNQVAPSRYVGLQPQLVSQALGDFGMNVGDNPVSTAPPGNTFRYSWYAGRIDILPDGTRRGVPVEFGAVNLMPADPIKQAAKGLIGALIIEPQGSTWVEDPGTRAAATVTKLDGSSFREFVVVFQNFVNLRYGDGTAVPNLAETEDPEDSGHKAFNYRAEPLWMRMGYAPETTLNVTRGFDFTGVLANGKVGGDPVTPVFTARAGTPVRFRVVHPGGNQRNNVFQVEGHIWQEMPFTNGSTVIGDNPVSEWKGAQGGHGPTNYINAVLQDGAGGPYRVPGDYLYRDRASFQFDGGLWGIFRVVP